MTIETKFNIGQPVWHLSGVYEVPMQDIIFAIKIQYNVIGQIEACYTFPERITWNSWLKKSELFASQQELIDYKNKNVC